LQSSRGGGCHRYNAHRNPPQSRSGIIRQAAKFCRPIFAHPFLASLSRKYLGFHHAHQKLVLIQCVLQIVIHLASAVQREKLRSALDADGRRPKVQNLFIEIQGQALCIHSLEVLSSRSRPSDRLSCGIRSGLELGGRSFPWLIAHLTFW
jgi:hypothetical protein